MAVYARGRDALLEDPRVAQALQEVAEHGWSQEAQTCARGALSALSNREAAVGVNEDQLHLMISCELSSTTYQYSCFVHR